MPAAGAGASTALPATASLAVRWAERTLGFRLDGARLELVLRKLEHLLADSGLSEEELVARASQPGSPEETTLIDLFTITETSFFRHPDQLTAMVKYLRRHVLPQKRTQERYRIRVWCAGCSTGEEAYSVAINLIDGLPLVEPWELELLATDVNPRVLQAAKEGIYSSREMADLDQILRERYFKSVGKGRYLASPTLKRHIRFFRHNLLSPPPQGPFDAVICRNVLIYMKREHVRLVLSNLVRAMATNGCLLLGPSELAGLYTRDLESRQIGDAIIYVRRSGKQEPGGKQ